MGQAENFRKGMFIGFLTGGALGAALALLYAPKSGKELRKDIKDKSEEYMDEAEKYIADAKDKAIDLINEGKTRSEKLIKDARDRSDKLLKDAEKIFQDAKEKGSEYVQTGKESVDQKKTQVKSAIKAGVDAYKDTKKSG
jgi:gas vesicle protein